MARIPEEKIEEVKDTVDIVSVISEYVDLKKSGRNFVGLCPFHNEKTPSFTVSSQKGLFHCFGCGEGGDVIGFIMKKENMSYPEAIRFLADKAGIFIESGSFDKRSYKRRKKLLKINEEARQFFYKNLLTREVPRRYLRQRGLDRECINRFFLGYADGNSTSLYRYLKNRGYRDEDMEELGLIAKSSYDNGYYDKYRDRLIFPIYNIKREVIGFGGRTLVNHPAKYINSKDSVVYNKSKNIYGVCNLNRISKLGKAVLVEGYMDVIALYDAGIDYAVASLGTALTEQQAGLIGRYADDIYICYDGDNAGQTATDKAIDIFREKEISPKVIEIPGGMDPDDFIKKEGPERFLQLEENAKDPVMYQFEKLRREYGTEEVSEKMKVVDGTARILASLKRPVVREEYARRLSDSLEIGFDSLMSEVGRYLGREALKKHSAPRRKMPDPKKNRKRKQRIIIYEAMRFVLFRPDSLEYFEKIGGEFQESFTMWNDFIGFMKEKAPETPTKRETEEAFPGAKKIIDYLYRVEDRDIYYDDEYFNKFTRGIRLHSLRKHRDELAEELEILEASELDGNLKEKRKELLIELMNIDKKLKGIGKGHLS